MMANLCLSNAGAMSSEKNGAVKMHEVAMRHAIEGAAAVSSWLSTRRIAGAAASSSTAGV
jgi:hypothetical protein